MERPEPRTPTPPHDQPRASGAPTPTVSALALRLLAVVPVWMLGACTPAGPRLSESSAQTVAQPTRAEAGEATLLLLADIRGVLRPCGCTKELQLGGFDRLAPVVAESRARGPTLTLHAGPLFHEASPEEEGLKRPQRERQAEVVAELAHKVGIDLVAPHPLDEARSPERYASLIKTSGAHAIHKVTGGTDSSLPWERRDIGGIAVGVLPLSPPLSAADPSALARLARTLAELGTEVDVVVGLSGLGLRETRRIVRKVPGLDVVVVGGMGEHPTVMAELELEGQTRLIQLHREGRNLGRLVLRRPAGWRRPGTIAEGPSRPDALTFDFELVRLPWTLPQQPEIAARMAAFDKELARINVAAAGKVPTPAPGEATYVGVEACFDCHAETRPFWQTTRHALAWETLEKLDKTFDTECVSCHVTGYGKPGGSLIGQVAGREDVQCEACHGPGSLHAADGDVATILRAPIETTCTACHNTHHSPSFAFATFRERLRVPGHGRPPETGK